jgi:hypothetical protein
MIHPLVDSLYPYTRHSFLDVSRLLELSSSHGIMSLMSVMRVSETKSSMVMPMVAIIYRGRSTLG